MGTLCRCLDAAGRYRSHFFTASDTPTSQSGGNNVTWSVIAGHLHIGNQRPPSGRRLEVFQMHRSGMWQPRKNPISVVWTRRRHLSEGNQGNDLVNRDCTSNATCEEMKSKYTEEMVQCCYTDGCNGSASLQWPSMLVLLMACLLVV